MHAAPAPDLVVLLNAATICKEFPAYKLADVLALKGQELLDVLRAVEMLAMIRKINAPS